MYPRTWTRIAILAALLVLLTAGIVGLLVGSNFEAREEEELRARLEDQVRAVAYGVAPLLSAGAPLSATERVANDYARLFGTRVTIIKPDGTVVGESEKDPTELENHADRPEVRGALADPGMPSSSSRLSESADRRLLYVAVAVVAGENAPPLGIARVAYPLTSIEQARNELWRNVVLAVLLVSAPAVLVGMLLVRSIVGPISRLRETASQFGAGQLSARSYIRTGDEIGELAREFNLMAEQLAETISQLREERNQMAAVLAYMQDGIIITGADGRVVGMNPAAAALFDTSPDEAVGRSLIELTREYTLHQALRQALAKATERQALEIKADGRLAIATITAVPNPNGRGVTGLVVLQDVTELRRLERARRDFIANIGHELRTPLASVKLLVETLEVAVEDDPQVAREFVRRIDVEVDGLTQLVRELLELSQIESGQVELKRKPVDVGEMLESATARLRAQAERAGLRMSVSVAPDLPPALADADRIEQVLVNLLHNAIKFTPPGGAVEIEAARDPRGVRIVVRDTGVGIPREELPRIFERFYKVDKARAGGRQGEGGTGLGLAIAKHIVQAHGGAIWAESELGEGATFFFTLPVE